MVIDKEFDKLSKTKCKHSYNERHHWERRGVLRSEIHAGYFMIWQCYGCELCIREKLTLLSKVDGA